MAERIVTRGGKRAPLITSRLDEETRALIESVRPQYEAAVARNTKPGSAVKRRDGTPRTIKRIVPPRRDP